jgi:hypothetical protein
MIKFTTCLKDGNRILLFFSTTSMEILRDSGNWHIDGTFKTCPSIFYQMVTIKCVISTSIVPAVYAFMEKKNKDNYIHLLTQLKSICQENNILLTPNRILTDFETALQDSIRIVFDGVQIKGCWFHYTQCLLRNLGLIFFNLNFFFLFLLILLCFKVVVTKLSMKITWHSGYGFVSSPHWLWCRWNTWKKHLQSYWTVATNT